MTNADLENAKAKEALTTLLRENVLLIEYDKVNGTQATMRASLRNQDLPVYNKTTDRVKEPRDDQIVVVDLDKQEYRTIKLNGIREYSIEQ